MTLKYVLDETTIKSRYSILSTFLKSTVVGKLDNIENIYFKHIFSKYYTPDNGEQKFDILDISDVIISNDSWGNKCFKICVNNVWYPASIKRLAGSNRNTRYNLLRAMRGAIQIQIDEFRNINVLNPNAVCPIADRPLGLDAQVDHIIPFHILAEEWLKNNENVTYVYSLEKMNYVLNEPYYTSWANFHRNNAQLRWLSKESNTYAHKYYVNKIDHLAEGFTAPP